MVDGLPDGLREQRHVRLLRERTRQNTTHEIVHKQVRDKQVGETATENASSKRNCALQTDPQTASARAPANDGSGNNMEHGEGWDGDSTVGTD